MNRIIVAAALFVLAFATFAQSAEWTQKAPDKDSPYAAIYVTNNGDCRVMIPREGEGVSVGANEKWPSGVTNEQFAEIKDGSMVHSYTYRTYVKGTETERIVGESEVVKDPFVFYRVCMPQGRSLPREIQNLFRGQFGLGR